MRRWDLASKRVRGVSGMGSRWGWCMGIVTGGLGFTWVWLGICVVGVGDATG